MSSALRRLKHPVFWLCLALFLGVLGAKLTLIKEYGSDLPYWDQWDAEAHYLYIPWAENRLTLADLFSAHNEHRIVFTRLLALGLLEANGQWDARLQMVVNGILHAAMVGALGVLVSRWLRPIALALFVAGTALILSLPIYAENTLAGFQSQFYFILLFAVWNIAGATLSRAGSAAWYWGHLAGAAGLFAMASGFVSSAVVMGITGGRLLLERRRPSALELLGLIWCALVIAAGYGLHVEVSYHQALRAGSPEVFFRSLLVLASWPTAIDKSTVRHVFAALLFLTPVLMVFSQWWLKKGSDKLATLILGLSGWWAAQVAVLAFARGGENHGLSARYFDVLCIQLIAGLLAWLWIFTTLKHKAWPTLVTLVAASALWTSTARRELRTQTQHTTRNDLALLKSVNVQREATIRDFVSGKLSSLATKKPWFELPHPAPEHLESLLKNSAILEILPVSVRRPIYLKPDATETIGFSLSDDGFWRPTAASSRGIHTFVSAPFTTSWPFLRFEISHQSSLELSAFSSATSWTLAEKCANPSDEAAIAWIPTAHAEAYTRVRVTTPSPERASFSNPREWGRLSLNAFRLTFLGSSLRVAAAISFIIGLALAAVSFIRVGKTETA